MLEPLLADGHDVLSVHISASISGTADSARQAAEQLEREGKGGERVRVMDSTTTAGGLGLVVLAAAGAAEAGEDLDAVERRASEAREDLKIWFAVDTLEFLKRGGRIGAASAWIGSTLRVKPILTLESELTPVERVRTSSRAFERLVDYARQRHESGADGWVVQHISAQEQAEQAGRSLPRDLRVRARVRERDRPRDLGPRGTRPAGGRLHPRAPPALIGARGPERRPVPRAESAAMGSQETATRLVVRTVLIVVCIVLILYVIYLLRRPIGWLLVATFLAVALSGPVNVFNRYMRRGFAIALVYLGLLAFPIALGAVIVPPLVTEINDLAENAPDYARDVTNFVNDNERLRELNKDYDITTKLQEEASKLPDKLGGAASTLRDVGIGIVNSIFALVTILILTAFMLGRRTRLGRGRAALPSGGARLADGTGAGTIRGCGWELRGRGPLPGGRGRAPLLRRS